MLDQLHIENIAVIERADIAFGHGLNVMTGETGAGKSIVIDSIQAVLGGRTSREIVRSGAEKAFVSAVFTGSGAEQWLEENGLETDDEELILQRRISADGKSACRVNGAPVTVGQLRSLGSLLLDIHGQNDGLRLLDESRHLGYLDSFGGYGDALAAYSAVYDEYTGIKSQIDALTMDELERERLTEDLKRRIDELERADIHPGEQDELNARRELMRNAEKLTEALRGAYEALYESEPNAVGLASDAGSLAKYAAGLAPDLAEAAQEIADAGFMLTDAAERIGDALRGLDFSPDEYDALENRLALLRRLTKKYSVADENGLLEALEASRERLDTLEYSGDALIKLKKQLAECEKRLLQRGTELTERRRDAAKRLGERIAAELKYLSMPSVRFEVDITPLPHFGAHGLDSVSFMMSANAGEPLGKIAAIASGGELSRIMLAMKSVFAESDPVGTLIFDEIDTGVSGIAAQRVGEKMASIAAKRQVICVTHLPQIAALADTHFRISKSEAHGRTRTEVTELDRAERVAELARLHGGDAVTDLTLRAAEEQLASAERFKSERL
ncbi:MAG: DNA repair protein RecN [Oscillospiraceae bacterium]|nr:DNA repair protein RecN [Oscillospiraceae bacterium]